jgi:cytosine deaminase
MTASLTLTGAWSARGNGAETIDVVIRDGVIESVAPSDGSRQGTDLTGFVLLPAPVEPHAHLDKALTSEIARFLQQRPGRRGLGVATSSRTDRAD